MKNYTNKLIRLFAATILLGASTSSALEVEVEAEKIPEPVKETKTTVLMKTTEGDIKIELDLEKAPKTVANFLQYTEEGHYDETIFHRVIGNFMIQGGGFTENMAKKNAKRTVKNEANNGLKNKRGTIAMARTGDPHSAGAQFFINVKDNFNLDFKSTSRSGWGYCVFGQVVEGMEVVDKIRGVATKRKGHYNDVPVKPIIITNVSVMKQDTEKPCSY